MKPEFNDLRRLAADVRINTIRSLEKFGSGHIGGTMSIADILSVLYGRVLRYKADDPNWEDRDRFVMSKGHCGPAQYAVLALSGFFPKDWLNTLNRGGTRLPSHCDNNKTPGIDASTGSLGQGVSVACGFAQGAVLKGKKHITYALLGDGELQEGQVWEAVQFAVAQKLDRLVMLVDDNGKQLDGPTISGEISLVEKFSSFGCEVYTVNGHDVAEMAPLLEKIRDGAGGGKPVVVILKTTKGGGCIFSEEKELNHHMPVSAQDATRAVNEIERRLAAGLLPGGESQ
ncbi:MAG: transketolase [Oscillospiraceae bacterium]|nr:transketolase [Oscillospiraceae bacterium]